LTDEKLERYLLESLDRLAYTSGIVLGLSPPERREEFQKHVDRNMAFLTEVNKYLEGYFRAKGN
jgi:hypothetical protein